MTMDRYREFLLAAPPLSKGDFSRLKEFRPRLRKMFLAEHWVFYR